MGTKKQNMVIILHHALSVRNSVLHHYVGRKGERKDRKASGQPSGLVCEHVTVLAQEIKICSLLGYNLLSC